MEAIVKLVNDRGNSNRKHLCIASVLHYSMLLLVLLFVSLTLCCHPECRWACDDPVCPAVCRSICEEPVCETTCTRGPITQCHPPVCTVRCPVDQCEADACPACETVCDPLVCTTVDAPCKIRCQATECSWKCHLPSNCQRPHCVLQCEKPACEHVPASATTLTIPISLLLLIVGTMH